MDEENNYSDVITRAIRALNKNVLESNKTDGEKKAINVLLSKIYTRYCEKMNSFRERDTEKQYKFQSNMVDVITELDGLINQECDVYYYINQFNNRFKFIDIENVSKKKILR